ncbi:hypothetical protein KKF91_12990 [Myxococcota bacterium]|nr:hypothetical protein [Myxococcota bacterium]MBU1431451.1 hypothetical protein [Myxococcota bacterium]MBU1896415.1 hypothetical protein [Myxococcota bacterium]
MIHITTAAGGRVEHLVRLGAVVRRGALLARVYPEGGPVEEISAPIDGAVEVQRLGQAVAPQFTALVGIRRLILADCAGRVRWIATLGPVGLTTMVALLGHEGGVRPHRAGTSGFVGARFVAPGDWVEPDQPLLEIRGETLV